MAKVDRLISEVRREVRGADNEDAIATILNRFATKPAKRIPAKRTTPRVSKQLHPRTDAGEAITVFPDGREVCNDNAAGRREYERRTVEMWERQSGTCPICGMYVSVDVTTFDHEDGRTSGHKDERLWRSDGSPMNAAVHEICNSERGSKRTPYKFQTDFTQQEWEAAKRRTT